ncbi:putative beta-lactamase superfamily protein [Rosellinia necatrix]|uniref:Putative beta-lactamase superfamily protein n=1 Tax=Rosellinia necatrix TaxID=77044 RepID=A0A1W2TDD3_ROSNE|nr:putative beta-lactamase superfamily protein [Rosellinia necatrix]
MALTVKHLNSDASFLLSFEPVIPDSVPDSIVPRPFTILLDPWITGPSTIFHPRISTTSHKQPACISSLAELPQPPDVVIVSQHQPDHCNEATLRQLPTGGRTLILAEPASARVIRSWRHFDKCKIRTIERWEDPRVTGKQSVIRIPVPPLQPNGREGEVTVAFIPQKHDIAGLHSAIGITYRSPATNDLVEAPLAKLLTPPSTPSSHAQKYTDAEIKPHVLIPTGDTFLLPPTPPISPIAPMSPGSLRSIRSASTLTLYSPNFRPSTSYHNEKILPPSLYSHSRPISLIFSPHGIQYRYLAPYATSHLVAEAALPLTALLHCIDSISNPWWLGGNICAGVPYGAEIASKLEARLWISAHDADKDVRGLATGLLKTRRWKDEEIEGALESGSGVLGNRRKIDQHDGQEKSKGARKGGTEILRLHSGEEILVAGTGQLWRATSSNGGILSDATPTKESIAPPPPVNLTLPTKTRQHGKYGKKTIETLMLPKVQDAMIPKTLGIYKALRTKDLIKPAPRLVIEQETTGKVDQSLPELKRIPIQGSPATKTDKASEAGKYNDAVQKTDSSFRRSVRFALSA